MADGPSPAKQKPKAGLTDARTLADGPPPAKNKLKPGYRQYPICNEWDSNLKKHIKSHHLPIFLDPQMVSWTCEKFVRSFGCLKKFHLNEHPIDNVFIEEYLEQWYSQINFLLHTI